MLLCAPVNATWAANHADSWRKLGFSGFVLGGIADDPGGHIWAVDGDPQTVGLQDALVLEVRFALERLAEAGIARNFVRVNLRNECAFSQDLFRDAVEAMDDAALFARLARAQGLALDLTSSPPVASNHQRSNARPSPLPLSARSIDEATALGRKLAETIGKRLPRPETLCIVDDVVHAPPRVFALVLGLCEGFAAIPEARFQVLTRAGLHVPDPGPLERLAKQSGDILSAHLNGRVRDWWRARGGIALGLEPLSGTSVLCSPEAFRVQLAVAKAFSGRYVWVEAAANSWWKVSAEEVPSFSVLLQNGAAVRSQTGPLPADPEAYALSTPLDNYSRAGVMEALGTRVPVFSGQSGAALAFFQGSPEAVTLENRTAALHVTDLRTGTRETIEPRDGSVTVGPFREPVLVENLPARDWVVPAGLWVVAGNAPPSPVTSTPLAYGWCNRSELGFNGTLEMVAPERFAVVPPTLELALGAGQEAAAKGALRGHVQRGTAVPLRMVLASPGSPPVTRTFSVPIPPALLWQVALDGPVDAAPIAVNLRSAHTGEILAVSQFGDVACIDGNGNARWHAREGESPGAAAAAGLGWSGGNRLAVAGDGLRILGKEGKCIRVIEAGRRRFSCPPRFAHLNASSGRELVAGDFEGRVTAFREDGKSLWSVQLPGAIVHLDCLDLRESGMDDCLALASGRQSRLIAISARGRALWQVDLAAASRCPFLVGDIHGDWQWTVVAGFDDGRIMCIDPASGKTREEGLLPSGGPVLGVACGDLLPTEGQEILAATSRTLYCLSASLDLLWQVPLPMGAAPAVARRATTPVLLAPTTDGDLVCLDARGRELWRDRRAAGAIRGTPLLASKADTAETVCVYASEDRYVRAIQLPD